MHKSDYVNAMKYCKSGLDIYQLYPEENRGDFEKGF
jgi:hypothetical protein